MRIAAPSFHAQHSNSMSTSSVGLARISSSWMNPGRGMLCRWQSSLGRKDCLLSAGELLPKTYVQPPTGHWLQTETPRPSQRTVWRDSAQKADLTSALEIAPWTESALHRVSKFPMTLPTPSVYVDSGEHTSKYTSASCIILSRSGSCWLNCAVSWFCCHADPPKWRCDSSHPGLNQPELLPSIPG